MKTTHSAYSLAMNECSVFVQFRRYTEYSWIEAKGPHALNQRHVVCAANPLRTMIE